MIEIVEIGRHLEGFDLEGSEKQTQWAKSIRQKLVRQLETGGLPPIIEALKPVYTEADVLISKITTAEQLAGASLTAAVHACRNPSAKWWIDHREDNPYTWLKDSWHKCVQHWSRNPPFA